MYSIILTHEANNYDVRVSIGKFLEARTISFLVLKDRSEYSGFLIQQDLSDNDINSIKTHIRTYPSQSCIFFEEGVMQTPQFREPKTFEFEDYESTDIDGVSVEMTIDGLINDVYKDVRKIIINPITRQQAYKTIAELWIQKIQEMKRAK